MIEGLKHKGIYYPDEISLLLDIDRQKVRRWIKNYWQDRIIMDNAIDFYSFIEMYVFMVLRDYGWSMQRIKKMHSWLKKRLNTDYPFAHFEFYVSGNDLVFDKGGFVSAMNYPGQRKFTEMLKPFSEKIEFSGTSKMAERFFPMGKDGWIVSDPDVRAGEPVIRGTRIDTWTIYSLLKAGESPKNIAWAYGLPVESIEAVKKFYKLEV